MVNKSSKNSLNFFTTLLLRKINIAKRENSRVIKVK